MKLGLHSGLDAITELSMQTFTPTREETNNLKETLIANAVSIDLLDGNLDLIACVHISEKIKLGSDVDRFR